MNCPICASKQRSEIEMAILNLSDSQDLKAISEEFEVTIEDLQMHALMHTPLPDGSVAENSLSRKIKLREADLISRTAHDYLITMTSVGRRIRYFSDDSENELALSKLLSKAMVDLYLGCGSEIRQSVNALSDLNSKINGDNAPKSGLQALAEALAGSRTAPEE